MSTPIIGVVLPDWPIPGIDAIRQRWDEAAEWLDIVPDAEFTPRRVSERWVIGLGTDSRGEPTYITADFLPCDSYFDPYFAEAVGWEPRGEFWVWVWKLMEGLHDRFERAVTLVHEVARETGGLVVLDHRDVVGAPAEDVFVTEVGAYVTAKFFGRMMQEPDFAWRML